MNNQRLPDGFAVQVDRRVRVLGAGSALLGGSPTRLLRLAPAARSLLDDGRLEVNDALTAQLARTLLDATVAHPRPASGPSHRDVTVVIPVRDNIFGLRQADVHAARYAGHRGRRRLGLSGASERIQRVHCKVDVMRHQRSKGPAAARNTGLAACETDFVAFLDSDVVPRKGWLEALLGHFSDPAVTLVAPRIVGLSHGRQPGCQVRGGAFVAGSGPARSAGGALRFGVLCTQRGDHLPTVGAIGYGRFRRDAGLRRGRRFVLALR